MPASGQSTLDQLKAKWHAFMLRYAWSTERRADAARRLGQTGSEIAVPPLVEALDDKSDAVRENAAVALGRSGDPRAVAPLIKVLSGSSQSMKLRAIESLAVLGDARAAPPIIRTLKGKSRKSKRVAAKALGRLADGRAVEPLIETLLDENPDVKQSACGALVKIGTLATKRLASALTDPNYESAVREIVEILSALGWEPDSPESRAIFCVTLGKWDDCVSIGKPAITPLIAALAHAGKTREGAAKALVGIGANAVRPLMTAAKKDARVMEPTVEILGRIGNELAVPPLLSILKSHPTRRIKNLVTGVLVQIGDPAIQPLIDIFEKMRDERAALLLQGLGWEPDDPQIKAEYYIALERWDDCAKLGPAAVPPLLKLLKGKDFRKRENARLILGRIDDPSAKKALADAPKMRKKPAKRHVADEPKTEVDTRDIKRHLAGLRDGLHKVRLEAAKSLGMAGDPRATEPLIAALGDHSREVRRAAIVALKKLSQCGANELLIKALRSENELLRHNALGFLDGMNWSPQTEGERVIRLFLRRKMHELKGLNQEIVRDTLIDWLQWSRNPKSPLREVEETGRILEYLVKSGMSADDPQFQPAIARLQRAMTTPDEEIIKEWETEQDAHMISRTKVSHEKERTQARAFLKQIGMLK